MTSFFSERSTLMTSAPASPHRPALSGSLPLPPLRSSSPHVLFAEGQ
ncbi:hypothetical protein L6R29_25910 [Myxococcota bacterium]|nr:hypothetical protein [Myxococcota bacterium]